MNLLEWTVQYVRQRDLVKRDLVSFREEGSSVVCDLKEGQAVYFCQENLDLEKIKAVEKGKMVYFVCLCNEYNFKLVSDNWDLLKTKDNLSFILLNPNMFDKWVIKPFVHAKIADPATLRQGLRTMYETCLGKDTSAV